MSPPSNGFRDDDSSDRTVIDTTALSDPPPAKPPVTPPAAPEPAASSFTDFDDGEEAGATVMIQVPSGPPPAARAPAAPQGHLVCIQGNDLGRAFPLDVATSLIGRGLNCTLILNDPSVSRQHFNIIRSPEGFKLIDLGSGNGTLVNGTRVHEIVLREGALIEIGVTKLKFMQGAAPASGLAPSMQAAPGPAPPAPVMPRVATGPPQPPAPQPRQAPAPEQAAASEEEYDYEPTSRGMGAGLKVAILLGAVIVLGGGGFLLADKFAGLGAVFSKAPRVAAVTTADAEHLFDEGRELLEAGRFQAALRKFEEAEEIDPSLRGLAAARRQAQEQLDAERYYESAIDALDQGDPAEAMKLLAIIPEGTAAYADAQQKLDELKSTAATPPVVIPEGEGTEALQLYAAKNFDGALTAFRTAASAASDPQERSALDARAQAVQAFATSYARAQESLRQNQLETAVRQLDEALLFDERVGGVLGTELRLSAARALVTLARDAAGRRDFAAAGAHAHRAFSYDPSSDDVRSLRDELGNHIAEIVLLGRGHMSASRNEEALATFQVADWLTPDGHMLKNEIDSYINILRP